MSITITRVVLIALPPAALLLAACGGGMNGAQGRSITENEYIILSARMDAGFAHAVAELLEAGPEATLPEQADRFLEMAELFEHEYARLVAVSPPKELRDYHEGRLRDLEEVRRTAERAADLTTSAATAINRVDSQQFREAMNGLLESVSESSEAEPLVVSALRTRSDALAAYLVRAHELNDVPEPADNPCNRVALFRAASEAPSEEDFRSTLLECLEPALAEAAAAIERWMELSPPPEAVQYHQDSLSVLEEATEQLRGMKSALEKGLELSSPEFSKPPVAHWFHLIGDWYSLAAEALSRWPSLLVCYHAPRCEAAGDGRSSFPPARPGR